MSNKIKIKAPAKINLTLDVSERRPDGYHNLQMIMQTINIYDELTISETGNPRIELTMNQELPDKCPMEKNLVYRAAKLMQETYSLSSGFRIHLTKNIPAAAGLAGGSSDCAATLIGINKLCGLGLLKEELCRLGVKLGADVPFCIRKGTMLAEGIGDILTPLADLPPTWLVLIKPDIFMSTAHVYNQLNLQKIYSRPDTAKIIRFIARHDVSATAQRLCNVLETVALPENPIIAELKEYLLQNGAIGSLMSGSGPTVYGIFRDKMLAQLCYRSAKEKYPDFDVILCQTVNE